MAITNHERIGKCLEQLTAGLRPFIECELKNNYQDDWFAETRKTLSATQVDFFGTPDQPKWDTASLLATLWNQWNEVFKKVLGHTERSLVSELRDVRNKWAHQQTFTTDVLGWSRHRDFGGILRRRFRLRQTFPHVFHFIFLVHFLPHHS
ncbi:MAG: hypothetical protein LBK60_04240 [Verrucomicrobiales bacterium]|jgi:hypothetical protein|nr:hypothetical protein [Verrucomicrobiales bacterium]